MNQINFSKEIGISQGTLSEIESGNNNPSMETLVAIKRLTGLSIDYMVTGDEEENKELDFYENCIINNYRMLSDRDRIEVETYIDFLIFEKMTLINKLPTCNLWGGNKVVDIDTTISYSLYRKKDTVW